MSKHTPDEIRDFAQKHAPALAEKISALCGDVITKGMVGILEEGCRLQAQRDALLEALQELCDIVQNAIEQKSAEDLDSFTLQPARAAIATATQEASHAAR